MLRKLKFQREADPGWAALVSERPGCEGLFSCLQCGACSGSKLTITNDPAEAARGAHAIYTDVWASMGAENEAAERRTAFADYQVDDDLFRHAEPEAIFMHCLPAKRGR